MADMRMRGFDGLRLGPNWLSPRLGRFTGECFERSGLTDFSPTVISIVHPKFNPKFNSGGKTAQGASPGQVKTYVERGACRVDRQLVLFEVFRPKSELSEAFVRMSQTKTLNFELLL